MEGVNFFTGFCVEGHTHAIRKKKQDKPKRNNALWVAQQLGIKLHIVDVIDEYKDVLNQPKTRLRRQHLNPCLDCKSVYGEEGPSAWSFMEEHNGFDFIITGEVMGQRPKSQRKETLPLIAKESGCGRPAAAPPVCKTPAPNPARTREGWVDP